MATMSTPAVNRRHIPDRRASVSSVSNKASSSRLSAIDWIAMTLLIIGGLNWGLIGFFNIDLVARLLGDMTPASRVVYALVGLSALYSIYTSSKMASRNR